MGFIYSPDPCPSSTNNWSRSRAFIEYLWVWTPSQEQCWIWGRSCAQERADPFPGYRHCAAWQRVSILTPYALRHHVRFRVLLYILPHLKVENWGFIRCPWGLFVLLLSVALGGKCVLKGVQSRSSSDTHTEPFSTEEQAKAKGRWHS